MIPSVPQTLVERVKKLEGRRGANKPYWDYKQWSGAYGTRASGPNDRYGLAEAARRLRAELSKSWSSVNKFAPNAPPEWKERLASLTYNAGGKWKSAGLGAAVKRGDWNDAARRFAAYNKAGGEFNQGLANRRAKELSWSTSVAPAAPAVSKMVAVADFGANVSDSQPVQSKSVATAQSGPTFRETMAYGWANNMDNDAINDLVEKRNPIKQRPIKTAETPSYNNIMGGLLKGWL